MFEKLLAKFLRSEKLKIILSKHKVRMTSFKYDKLRKKKLSKRVGMLSDKIAND